MSQTLCQHCTALCCRYFALPIDKPRTAGDFDDIRWFLMHEGVTVFVEDGQWYVSIAARCKNLLPDNRCAIYQRRPRICRNYKADQCDYHPGGYDYQHYFTSAESLETFARRSLRDRYRRNSRRRRHQVGKR